MSRCVRNTSELINVPSSSVLIEWTNCLWGIFKSPNIRILAKGGTGSILSIFSAILSNVIIPSSWGR